jgi:hypothetical protein
MAIVQLRRDTPGRTYYRRRLVEGKTTMEALRTLKRHLSDVDPAAEFGSCGEGGVEAFEVAGAAALEWVTGPPGV